MSHYFKKILLASTLALPLLLGSTVASAATVECSNDYGTCEVSNDGFDEVTCTCNDEDGFGSTGSNEWDDYSEQMLDELCLSMLSDCEWEGVTTSTGGETSDTDGWTDGWTESDSETTGCPGETTGWSGSDTDPDTGCDPNESESETDWPETESDSFETTTMGETDSGCDTGDSGETGCDSGEVTTGDSDSNATTGDSDSETESDSQTTGTDGETTVDSGGETTVDSGGETTVDSGGETTVDSGGETTGEASDSGGNAEDDKVGCAIDANTSDLGLFGLALMLIGVGRRRRQHA